MATWHDDAAWCCAMATQHGDVTCRSVCAKLLRTSLGKQMDNANLFVYINMFGALALFPLAIFVDGNLLVAVSERESTAHSWMVVAPDS